MADAEGPEVLVEKVEGLEVPAKLEDGPVDNEEDASNEEENTDEEPGEVEEEAEAEEDAEAAELEDVANPTRHVSMSFSAHEWQTSLTYAVAVLVKDGIDVLKESSAHEPRVLDNLLAVNVAGTLAVAVLGGDPVLGRDVVVDTRKGNGNGRRRVAGNGVRGALLGGALYDAVQLVDQALGAKDVRSSRVDVGKLAANTGLLAVVGHVIEVDGPVSALGGHSVVGNVTRVLGRVGATKLDFAGSATLGSTAEGDTKDGALDRAGGSECAEKVGTGTLAHGETEDSVKCEVGKLVRGGRGETKLVLHAQTGDGKRVSGQLALDLARAVGNGKVLAADLKGAGLAGTEGVVLGAGVAGAVGAHDPAGTSASIDEHVKLGTLVAQADLDKVRIVGSILINTGGIARRGGRSGGNGIRVFAAGQRLGGLVFVGEAGSLSGSLLAVRRNGLLERLVLERSWQMSGRVKAARRGTVTRARFGPATYPAYALLDVKGEAVGSVGGDGSSSSGVDLDGGLELLSPCRRVGEEGVC